MLEILAERTYRHLFLAQVVALLGTGLATVALGLLAYDLAGEEAAMVLGTVFTIKMLAYVGLSPLAHAVVARLPRKAVMIGADLVRGGAALCLPFVSEVWQVYVLIFVLQAASATFTPTFQAVIPDLLPDEGECQVDEALTRHDGLRVDRAALDRPGIDTTWITPEGGLRLRPDFWADRGGMDGFYIACLRKPD